MNIDSSTGFSNASAGQDPDRVYGMVLCRGDIDFDECRMLVQLATDTLPKLCPNRMQAILWHENCTLRYSNEEIVGTLETFFMFARWKRVRVLDPAQFKVVLTSLLDDLRIEAALSISPKKIAVGRKADPPSQTVYALVQCTPDLHPDDCKKCLSGAAAQLQQFCDGMTGCGIFRTSCFLQHETYLFFNESRIRRLVVPAPVPAPRSMPVLPDVPQSPKGSHGVNSTRVIVPVAISIIVCLIILVFVCILLRRRRSYKKLGDASTTCGSPQNDIQFEGIRDGNTIGQHKSVAEREICEIKIQQSPPTLIAHRETVGETSTADSMQFAFSTIRAATNDFADENKLGKGGFGTVYEGSLLHGQNIQKIAVKRLSLDSTQGEKEFVNEVSLLVRLQHKNLVQLLGYAIEDKEKVLVYELVPNGSLNHHIYDPTKPLDWNMRYKIIQGIGRGLLYLHEGSPEKMIHLDLKASNVLLDEGMNPKISDFGLAKLLGHDKTHGSTKNSSGTSGYMAPEYTMHGKYSPKCDVFSFGVLLLEIISGRRRNCMTNEETETDLLCYALKNWHEGRKEDTADSFLRSSSTQVMSDVVKCINIGLLCVEDKVSERPIMSIVVDMLSNLSTFAQYNPSEASFKYWMDAGNSSKGYSAPQSSVANVSKNTMSKTPDDTSGR